MVGDLDSAKKKFTTFQTSRSKFFKAFLKFLFTRDTNIQTHYTYFGRPKVKVILKFDDESLGTMEIPFFDIGNHVAFSYNPKIYSEAMRKMAEDLKRKNSWISRQIKK